MSTPAPFDSDYTATNFVGFSISVDIVASDQTLGAKAGRGMLGQTPAIGRRN